ncbi:MAG: penicillin-binding protein [Polyangiaceae bacterium]|nr:penicillin-binding protein [Polyangiaceae bacterium]
MRAHQRWLGIGLAVGIISALVPVVRGQVDLDSLRKLAVRKQVPPPSLAGLDLTRIKLRPRRAVVALADGREAELTIDPDVQRVASSTMRRYRVPEAGLVMMDVKTGKILAYASHVQEGERFDVNARAEAPSASVFKVVTGAALVEKGGQRAESEQCYHGGKSRLAADELVDDPKRDKWCATLAIAMGRSLNVVFGRMAQKHLTPEDVTAMAGAFGYGAPIPFVVPNEAPGVDIPDDPLEFARSAAGFWHTTLSPLAAASMAQTVANGGIALEPRIIAIVSRGGEKLWEDASPPRVLRRAIRAETAAELTTMMVQTTANGSAYKTFHDERGRPFLPGITVAGKTGTLTRHKANRHYTWFIGFAPAERPEVAVAALVVNTPIWQIKGPQLAREALHAYFSKRGMKPAAPAGSAAAD